MGSNVGNNVGVNVGGSKWGATWEVNVGSMWGVNVMVILSR